jgi:hypothetical protein
MSMHGRLLYPSSGMCGETQQSNNVCFQAFESSWRPFYDQAMGVANGPSI